MRYHATNKGACSGAQKQQEEKKDRSCGRKHRLTMMRDQLYRASSTVYRTLSKDLTRAHKRAKKKETKLVHSQLLLITIAHKCCVEAEADLAQGRVVRDAEGREDLDVLRMHPPNLELIGTNVFSSPGEVNAVDKVCLHLLEKVAPMRHRIFPLDADKVVGPVAVCHPDSLCSDDHRECSPELQEEMLKCLPGPFQVRLEDRHAGKRLAKSMPADSCQHFTLHCNHCTLI